MLKNLGIPALRIPKVPPRVEYELSEKGKTLENILNQLSAWGKENVTQFF